MSTIARHTDQQQIKTSCSCFLAIESEGYVITGNEILACEYTTECNVAPTGVHKPNNQTLNFGYVVIGN